MTDALIFAEPTRIYLPATPLAVVRHENVRLADLPTLFARDYGIVGALFESGAAAQAGPPLAVYRGDPQDVFDLEIGFPITASLIEAVSIGVDRVDGSAFPPGPAYAATYVGSYDGLGSAWAQLVGAIPEQPSGIWIESYVSGPGAAGELPRTDLMLPTAAL